MTSAHAPAPAGDGSVVIVVVNWNGRDLVEACLTAALAQQYPAPHEVVLVDNLSSDDSVALVTQRFPSVRVLVNDANNYSRANNRGAALARSEFIALLNTDAEPKPDWLSRLVSCMRDDPGCGAATALVRFPDGRVNSTGIESLPGFHWRDRDFGAEARPVRPSGEVDGVSGCAVLWRRQCWDELRGLDEDFEMYYEDVDASLRARAGGWRLRYCQDAEVSHRYNASIQQRERAEGAKPGFRLKDQLGERNRLLVLARHYRPAFVTELAASRFFLDAAESGLERGLELALGKWLRGALPAPAQNDLVHLLLTCRSLIVERESWARRSELEVGKRELQVFEILSRLDAVSTDLDHSRQRGQALERQLAEAQRQQAAMAAEQQRLNQEIVAVHKAYQAEQARVQAELVQIHAAYQREIGNRDQAIGELRQHFDAASSRGPRG